ncbi:unnamed protein product [Calypogeia fissa]
MRLRFALRILLLVLRGFPESSDLGQRLSYETLHWATDGFSVKLGRGSIRVVYKGTLLDGTDIAVKKLLDRERDMKDFEAELRTLGRINHANLVALLGFTFENNKLFLIYEFIVEGSLDRWIFKDVKEIHGEIHRPSSVHWSYTIATVLGADEGGSQGEKGGRDGRMGG